MTDKTIDQPNSTAERWVAGGWMQTYTGRAFYPLNPEPEDFVIEDIAHALSLTCRYGGHVNRFYSVAEHSVLISYAIERALPVGPAHARLDLALWGLLHDAAEAYVGDMVRPLKQSLPEFSIIESRILCEIATACRLPIETPEQPYPVMVGDADSRILLDERAALLGPPAGKWAVDDLEPLGVHIEGLIPEDAEQAFLARYASLQHRRLSIGRLSL